jgi:hypothetical protein
MPNRAGQAALMAAGLAALVLIVRHIGPATIAGLLRQVGWSFLTIAVIYAGHTALRGVALWQTLPAGELPLADVVAIRFGTEGVEMLTLTGPFLAEPAKAWLLHRRGIDGPAAVGAVAAEFLLYNLTAAWVGAGGLAPCWPATRFRAPPRTRAGAARGRRAADDRLRHRGRDGPRPDRTSGPGERAARRAAARERHDRGRPASRGRARRRARG